jgi:hypothetical protein
MLFRTIYGPELEAIYLAIHQQNKLGVSPNRETIYSQFLPMSNSSISIPTQNLDDALTFLRSSGLIEWQDGYRISLQESKNGFHLHLLRCLTILAENVEEPSHPLDPLFLKLLDELFILPNRLFIDDIHQEANRLKSVQALGGISREKIQAWKRVMEYLGIGFRAHNGFLCTYDPELILSIVRAWSFTQGTLQSFLEEHFSLFLPFRSRSGEIAQAAALSLIILKSSAKLDLYPLQDSPTRFYFEGQKLRGISIR